MSTLAQPYSEHAIPREKAGAAGSPLAETSRASVSCPSSLYYEQLQSLVQQLFFNDNAARHVGITAVDESTEITNLCFDIAQILANEGRYDIGLIDANLLAPPLETQLELARPEAPDSASAIAPNLWFVPRQSWLGPGGTWTEQSAAHLRELAAEFDFSILQCPSVSWLTTRIGRACDGLVLVLTAHKTRRVVARRIRDQLQKIRIPLLGTIIRERRLPIPEALYRSL